MVMNIVVILSGGTGNRTGLDIPKQYIEVNGRPMIYFCMETFFAHEEIDAVQIVADKAWQTYILHYVSQIEEQFNIQGKFWGFSDPGVNRQMSIYHALTDVRIHAEDNDRVFIHDAARPFVTANQISRCLADMEDHEGVLPVLPMRDTVYMTAGKSICSLLDRKHIYAGQAPELFLLGKYYEANKRLLPERILFVNGSTEPAVLAGMDIWLSEGDEENFKVTTEKDMNRFKKRVMENFTAPGYL